MSSDFKTVIIKDVTYQWPHLGKATYYSSHEGRSVECEPTHPGAAWSTQFDVSDAEMKRVEELAKAHFADCKTRDSRMGNYELIHGQKSVVLDDGTVANRLSAKRKTITSKGKQVKEPPVVDGRRMPLEDRNFWSGSRGNIKVTLMPTLNQSKGQWGISMLLDSVQVVDARYGDAGEDFDIVDDKAANTNAVYDFDDEIPFGT